MRRGDAFLTRDKKKAKRTLLNFVVLFALNISTLPENFPLWLELTHGHIAKFSNLLSFFTLDRATNAF